MFDERERSSRLTRKRVPADRQHQPRYLVAVASVAAKDRAELAQRFKLPNSSATNSSFLTSVKSLIATAEQQKELLVKEGMSESLLDDLGGKVAEFEAAISR